MRSHMADLDRADPSNPDIMANWRKEGYSFEQPGPGPGAPGVFFAGGQQQGPGYQDVPPPQAGPWNFGSNALSLSPVSLGWKDWLGRRLDGNTNTIFLQLLSDIPGELAVRGLLGFCDCSSRGALELHRRGPAGWHDSPGGA